MAILSNNYKRSTLLTLLSLMAACTPNMVAEARSYSGMLAPRSYQYGRPRDPFDLMSDIFSMPVYNANSLFRQLEAERNSRSSTPRYSVTEENGVLELSLEVPGMSASDLIVQLEDNALVRIKGARRHHSNAVTEFDQSFQLDKDVDPDRLTVTLSNGILSIKAPRKERKVVPLPIVTEPVEEMVLEATAVTGDTLNEVGEDVVDVDGFTITEEDISPVD